MITQTDMFWLQATAAAAACLALLPLLCPKHTKAGKFAAFFVELPCRMALIAFDAKFAWLNPFVGFPRNQEELLRNKNQFFKLLQSSKNCGKSVPSTAQFVSLELSGKGIAAEPGKDKQMSIVRLTYRDTPDSSPKEVLLFCKFQTERQIGLFLRALSTTFAEGHKEVDFYTKVARLLPDGLQVPSAYLALYSRTFHRNVVALELVPAPYEVIPDWKGVQLGQMCGLIDSIAKMHAHFWCPGANVAPFLTDRVGTSWLDGLMQFYLSNGEAKQPQWKWMHNVWNGVSRYFASSFMCLSHGDCRPGNMLFAPPAKGALSEHNPSAVVMTDWEALCIAPHMWDVAYATICGLSPENRRAWRSQLVQRYVDHLKPAVLEADRPRMVARVDDEYALAIIVIAYFGWVLSKVGGVGATQGNSDDDCYAWQDRIYSGYCDYIAPKIEYFADLINVSADDLRAAVDSAKPSARRIA